MKHSVQIYSNLLFQSAIYLLYEGTCQARLVYQKNMSDLIIRFLSFHCPTPTPADYVILYMPV